MKLNTIYYEDCIAGLPQRVPKESVDLAIADPPFGIAFDKVGSQYNRKKQLVVKGYKEVSPENYLSFSRAWLKAVYTVLKPTGSAYIVSGWSRLLEVLQAINESGFQLINHLIWKFNFGGWTKNRYTSSHYHILFVAKDPQHYYLDLQGDYVEDVWEIKKEYHRGTEKNATKLPEKLVTRMIHYSSKKGAIVLDPFMGNGTTAVCCLKTDRKYLGFEINTNAREVIERNIGDARAFASRTKITDFLEEVKLLEGMKQ